MTQEAPFAEASFGHRQIDGGPGAHNPERCWFDSSIWHHNNEQVALVR